jgi:hypothetical protein
MTPDDYKLINYALYTLITAGVTILVGRSLHRSGRVFLTECFGGNPEMADSVNHLLLVGFYLVNFGGLALFLKMETPPSSFATLVEALSFKVGMALTGLGFMHLFNVYNFDSLRTKAMNKRRYEEAAKAALPPPLPGAKV